MSRISVFGLGKLGSTIALLYASKGHKVIGVDVDSQLISKLNSGINVFGETGIDKVLENGNLDFTATLDSEFALNNTDVSLIVLPTPSNQEGVFDNSFIINCLTRLSLILKTKNSFHLFVLNSTVMPTSCETEFIPLIERISGKKVNKDFAFIYSPEFIALGEIIRNMTNPDLLLIGGSDTRSSKEYEKLALSITDSNPEIHIMNLANAEITKISINSYITMKISFANFLSEVCEKVPGGDVAVVTNAIGSDSRIGKKYLTGGTGFGGPCFPRDNIALSSFSAQLGVDASLAIASDKVNNRQVQRIINLIPKQRDLKILICSTSYKPKTQVSEESQGVKLFQELSNFYKDVRTFNPPNDILEISDIKDTFDHEIKNSNTIIYMQVEKIYTIENIGSLRDKILIDPWRQHEISLDDQKRYNIIHHKLGADHFKGNF